MDDATVVRTLSYSRNADGELIVNGYRSHGIQSASTGLLARFSSYSLYGHDES